MLGIGIGFSAQDTEQRKFEATIVLRYTTATVVSRLRCCVVTLLHSCMVTGLQGYVVTQSFCQYHQVDIRSAVIG